MSELVSVVIVAYHQRADLERLLPTMPAASTGPLEILVVDNGSPSDPGDDTRAWLQASHPAVRVLGMDANLGYGAANNLGVLEARGEWVLVLNPDTELTSGAIDQLLAGVKPGTFANPCLLLPDGRVNALGLSISPGGVATCQGLYERAPRDLSPRPVAALSGAAILGRRQDWLAVGGFVPEFFLYGEDVEWSQRARIRGFELLCVPAARVVHRYRAEIPPQKWFCLAKNRRLMVELVLEPSTRRRLRPVWVLTSVALLVYAARRGPRYLAADLAAALWVWRRRHWVARLAARMAAHRRLADRDLLERWVGRVSAQPDGRPVGGTPGRWYEAAVQRLADRLS